MCTLKPILLAEGKRAGRDDLALLTGPITDDRSATGGFRKALQSLLHQARRVIARPITAALLKERIRERERIARELHDTLIQCTQALILDVHVLSSRLPDEDPIRGSLAELLQRADLIMTQGRERILNLRESAGTGVYLSNYLIRSWSDLRGEGRFQFRIEGQDKMVEACVADEISMIGREAITNAMRHSRADIIEARVVFGEQSLRLCVRDDGVGISPNMQLAGPPLGHWGLPGMRERADELGAELEIRSWPGSGTEIRLMVPAEVAYVPGEGNVRGWMKRHWPRLAAKGMRLDPWSKPW